MFRALQVTLGYLNVLVARWVIKKVRSACLSYEDTAGRPAGVHECSIYVRDADISGLQQSYNDISYILLGREQSSGPWRRECEVNKAVQSCHSMFVTMKRAQQLCLSIVTRRINNAGPRKAKMRTCDGLENKTKR